MLHVTALIMALCLLLPGLALAEAPPQSFRIIDDDHSRTVRYIPEQPPGTFSKAFATEQGRELYSQLLLRYVTGDDFDGFVEVQIRTGSIAKAP
jgi:hypothetical protein